MLKNVGVVLSGCGVFDGSEIHEAVAILMALDKLGAKGICIAPNLPQTMVVNHLSRAAEAKTRNILEESARIARGKIRDIATVKETELDALIFPGGFGAVKNLCTYAVDGSKCVVNLHVSRLMMEMHQAKKPIGLACIAPVLAATLFGNHGLRPHITIGTDEGTAHTLQVMGAVHVNTEPADICVDLANKLVTTPCYMTATGPWQVFQGAEKMVEKVLELM